MTGKKSPKTMLSTGSALILTVVLTSLLAIIGVMFIMVARIDRAATSSIAENKDLHSATATIIAKISQELTLDVPGVAGQEYYDYPDTNNAWLASLEPYKNGTGDYRWRQISDVTGYIDQEWGPAAQRDVDAEIVEDHKKIELDNNGNLREQLADADGDGVADSKWVELDDITSGKGKAIYAAVRIIDNGGMINVNTAYKFDPNSTIKNDIDGSSQTQIDLFALAQRSPSNTIGQLEDMRKGGETWDLDRYVDDVVWRIEQPAGLWTPFDISDELKLRNRYILNYNLMTSRIEQFWSDVYDVGPRVPLPTTMYPFSRWPDCTIPGIEPNDYDYRHISTIYSMDRIIDPDGKKMLNINDANVSAVYNAIVDANLNIANPQEAAAQIAVNLKDYRDSDSTVTPFTPDVNGPTYYGFEQPCIYISELVHRYEQVPFPPGTPLPPPPPVFKEAYAIELYKPYFQDDDPCNWRLVISWPLPPGSPLPPPPPVSDVYDIDWSGGKQFYVIRNDPCGILPSIDIGNAKVVEDALTFNTGCTIELQRRIDDVNNIRLAVDSTIVPDGLIPETPAEGTKSFQRDITPHKCIRRLWDTDTTKPPTLGQTNNYEKNDSIYIQAHPADSGFNNIGEIGTVFRKSAYVIGPTDTEETVRLDLTNSNYQGIFKYLTVFDPNVYSWNEPNETRIKGRININTAPWFVLAQLPWVSDELAQAIVAYRDKDSVSGGDPDYSGRIGEPGFRNAGALNNIVRGNDDYRVDYYALDSNDLTGFPDLTTPDGPGPSGGAPDDFEERDVIFARISNLVTVRSDVFTAYILVRIGTDGPQKRVIAILDRSDVYSPTDKVKIVTVHPVPDPR